MKPIRFLYNYKKYSNQKSDSEGPPLYNNDSIYETI